MASGCQVPRLLKTTNREPPTMNLNLNGSSAVIHAALRHPGNMKIATADARRSTPMEKELNPFLLRVHPRPSAVQSIF
jgi:hypothetical protein